MPSFFEISKDLIGPAFELGKNDCFSVIYKYLELVGVKLPTEYKNLTLETYADLYREEPEKAREIMIEFIEDHLTEVPKGKRFTGDILLLSFRNYPSFFGIDAGNGQVITSFENIGTRLNTLVPFTIERVFKWAQHSALCFGKQ